MWYFEPPVTLALHISSSVPKLVQIGPELAETRPFGHFPRWRLLPIWISKKWYFAPPVTLTLSISISVPILVQTDEKWPIYALLCIFQDGSPVILNFHKVLFCTPVTLALPMSISAPNVEKTDKELPNICPFVHFPRWRPPPSWTSKKCYFWPVVTFALPISIISDGQIQIMMWFKSWLNHWWWFDLSINDLI